MNKVKIATALLIAICSTEANAALNVHTVATPELPEVTSNFNKPEDQVITGRARSQSLASALKMVTKNKMVVEFTRDGLAEMQINWRANGEPLQIMLTKFGRIYGLDVVINQPTETITIGVDTGQCDAHREAELRKTQRQWSTLNIDKMPTLPPRLAVFLDASGYEWRLC
jgi:hypothetical protein